MNYIKIVKIQMIKEGTLKVTKSRISEPKDAYLVGKEYLQYADRENLVELMLNTKNVITNINVVSTGSLNSSIVHPREIFKSAILANSASIILIHNHPSGDPTPSTEDLNSTNRIKECGKILGIELLDHVIIGDEKYISLKESGYI